MCIWQHYFEFIISLYGQKSHLEQAVSALYINMCFFIAVFTLKLVLYTQSGVLTSL